MTNSVWTAQARADWGSGHSFSVFLPPLLLFLFAIVFACFLAPPLSPDSRLRERSAGEAGAPYYCLIRLIQKVHYTTVLAPLRRFSLQPKGFFRRTRGRIYVAFGEHPAAGVCVCVCSAKLVVLLLGCLFVCVFVCLLVCLFVCLFVLCLFGCLFICVYVSCFFFATSQHNFVPQ